MTDTGIHEIPEQDSGDIASAREEKANALWEALSLTEKVEALEKIGFDFNA